MFNLIKRTISWGGIDLTLETGMMARQADSSVLVTYGETQVLATVVYSKDPSVYEGFVPLTVHYQEKSFAAGKIPGGFFKREARPSEQEILTSRMIDRPIRPLIKEGFAHETQIVLTVLSYDGVRCPSLTAMLAASASLAISGIPTEGILGCCTVGLQDGEFVLNPESEGLLDLDLTVAGTKEGILMVESQASELSNESMLSALTFAHENLTVVANFIQSFAEEVSMPLFTAGLTSLCSPEVEETAHKIADDCLIGCLDEHDRALRGVKLKAAEGVFLLAMQEKIGEGDYSRIWKSVLKKKVCRHVLQKRIRLDGRQAEDIRALDSRCSVLKRTHGSALFTRGETQVLAVTTLGTGQDEQVIDSLGGAFKEHVLLHYNFPSSAVGEVRRISPPGRREIGHGKLAKKALMPLLPNRDEFPYTIRVVSEVLESNGSSSMATVCASFLSMLDAGVPIKRTCAGIAMGLFIEDDQYIILSDIMGEEDDLGCMDFKVAGTRSGITALQMDIKVPCVSRDLMSKALIQAEKGRLHILDHMESVTQEYKPVLSDYAPRIVSFMISKDKIREVIGPSGKVIREICETTDVKIDIDDDGKVSIYAVTSEKANAAMMWIKGLVGEPEDGEIYKGRIVKVLEFGAFVNFCGSKDGLVHISELTSLGNEGDSAENLVQEGNFLWVKYLGQDSKKRAKLSVKNIDQNKGCECA